MAVVVRSNVRLPCTEEPIVEREWPTFTAEDYQARIARLRAAVDKGFTHMVFYGDREHFSNLEYFTGYDPRFEEAILIFSRAADRPMLIVGNEGWGYAEKIPLAIDKRKYTAFSLPNQPQSPPAALEELFREVGINANAKIALFGWKLFDGDAEQRMRRHDVPYYIVEALYNLTGSERVSTMNHIMIGSGAGLRDTLEPKELVLAEISGTRTSRSVYRALSRLKPGMTELEASAGLQIDGVPMAMHPNINFGAHVFLGLASPEPNAALQEGDLACIGMSYRRALCHKVGVYAREIGQLPRETRRVQERYFSGLTAWYEGLRIGATGGDVHRAIVNAMGEPEEMGIGLNFGHAIHTEEWTNSPFYAESKSVLHSGLMLQCDFSVYIPERNIAVHAEDGVVLADEEARAEIERIAPTSYKRMLQRQRFLREVLNIRVRDEVLPTSDMPAVVFPCMMDLGTVYANDGKA